MCTQTVTLAELKGMPLGILDGDYQFRSCAKAVALLIACCISLKVNSLEDSPVPIHKE